MCRVIDARLDAQLEAHDDQDSHTKYVRSGTVVIQEVFPRSKPEEKMRSRNSGRNPNNYGVLGGCAANMGGWLILPCRKS